MSCLAGTCWDLLGTFLLDPVSTLAPANLFICQRNRYQVSIKQEEIPTSFQFTPAALFLKLCVYSSLTSPNNTKWVYMNKSIVFHSSLFCVLYTYIIYDILVTMLRHLAPKKCAHWQSQAKCLEETVQECCTGARLTTYPWGNFFIK